VIDHEAPIPKREGLAPLVVRVSIIPFFSPVTRVIRVLQGFKCYGVLVIA